MRPPCTCEYRKTIVNQSRSGHTAIVEEDMKFFELSPAKEYDEVFENIQKRMAELSA